MDYPHLKSAIIFLISCTVFVLQTFSIRFHRKKNKKEQNPTFLRHKVYHNKSQLFVNLGILSDLQLRLASVYRELSPSFAHNPINSCEKRNDQESFVCHFNVTEVLYVSL